MHATTSLACERVRAIAAGAVRPEDALEQALRVLHEAVGATAGAVCLYDPDHGLLRLAAEIGLSDEGCRQLRTVGKGSGWETPLCSVRDRRLYVIRSAPGNRYVPPLVEQVDALRAVACIPLARGGHPLGTLILVTTAANGLPTAAIRKLRPAFRALVRLIVAARGGGEHLPRVVLPAEPSALESLATQALRGIEPVLRQAMGILGSTLAPFIATATDAAQKRTLDVALAGADAERRALAGRVDAAAAARVDLEARHAAELGRATARLAEAVARADGLQQELDALRARSASEREDGFRRAMTAARSAEEARAAAIVEVETLRAAMANAQAAIMAAEDEARRARADVGRQDATMRALHEERDRLTRTLDAARAHEQVMQAEAVDAARERDTVWAESERLVAEARVREGAAAARVAELEESLVHARARADERVAERDRLARDLEDAVARERRARDELVAEIARNADERDELLQRSLANTRSAEEGRAVVAGEVETLRAAMANAEAVILKAEDEALRARGDASRLDVALRAAEAESERLVHERDAARAAEQTARARLQQLEQVVETTREERTRVEAAADEREAESDERWAMSLHEAELALAREREHTAQLQAAEARLATELQEAVSRERLTRAEVERLLAQHAAERDDTLRRALDRASAAEEGRTAAVGESEAVRRTLVDVRAALVAAEDDARRLAGEAERFEASSNALAEERAQLRTELHDALGREQEARTRAAQLTADAEALREQLQQRERASAERVDEASTRWAARLADAERVAATAREQVTELARERDGMVGELRDAVARERYTREELTAVLARTETDRQETLRQALENTRAAEEARAAMSAEAEAARAALADARAAVLSAESETQRLTDALQQAEAAHQTVLGDLERATRELEETRTKAPPPVAAPAPPPAPPTPPAASAAAAPAAAPRKAANSSRVAVLDAAVDWPAADEAVVIAPGDGMLERIREAGAGQLVANLATPGVLEAVRALGSSAPDLVVRGCLGVAGAARVLSLGPIAVAGAPVDAEEVLALIATLGGKNLRVLAAGADPDPFLSLRHALTRSGMSVSVAWDGKQASDLLGMVRPELVVVDLGLPRGDGYSLVADLAGMDPVPSAILVARGPAQAGFTASLRDRLGEGGRAVTATAILSSYRR